MKKIFICVLMGGLLATSAAWAGCNVARDVSPCLYAMCQKLNANGRVFPSDVVTSSCASTQFQSYCANNNKNINLVNACKSFFYNNGDTNVQNATTYLDSGTCICNNFD